MIFLYFCTKAKQMEHISWGFIGCGEVTEKKSGPAFNEVEGSHVEAVMSRSEVKARSYAEQTFLIQLANGTEGYLPTEKAEKGGHYSAFIASGLVGHVGGEQLVRETLKNINRLFAE